MSGQTIVQYGNVVLYRCLTRRIDQRPEVDSANAGVQCWKFIVQVTGFLHGWPSACPHQDIVGLDTSTWNAPQVHRQLRWHLMPRQSFIMAVGCADGVGSGTVLLRANPMTVGLPPDLETAILLDVDLKDGPRCTEFDVVHVSADNIFKVEATFELHLIQCSDDFSTGSSNGVLSHRWSCADGLDVNLRATRTYRGMLELATSNFSPHWFRSLVVPPLQPGMRRESMQFAASEDGRRLSYTVVDQEVAISAPYPARRWSVEQTEHSLNQQPLQSHSQIVVILEGDGNVDKGQLILLGIYVVTAKLIGAKPGNDPAENHPVVMRDLTITDFTGDANSIRISASCERLGRIIRNSDAGNLSVGPRIAIEGFQKVISADDLPTWSVGYDPRLSASGRAGETPQYQGPVPLTGIFRCYLQSACSGDHGINRTSNALTTDFNGMPGSAPQSAIQAVIVPEIPSIDPPYYSVSHKSSMYTTYQMESIYRTHQLRAAMPIANAPFVGEGVDTRDACAVISLTRPQTRRVVRILAERVGKWPEMPNPESMEGGLATVVDPDVALPAIPQKLLRSKLLGGTRIRSCNGEEIYRARFEAVFALLRSPTPTELLKIGQNKWSADPATRSTALLTNSTFE